MPEPRVKAKTTKPVKPAKLTTKQRKLIKGVADGKSQKDAAIEAGYSEHSAETTASRTLAKEQVRATLQDLMEHMGLSDGALLIKHRELLNAQKQLSGVREAGSESVEFVEVPDHAVQCKALEMAYKLKGAFTEKIEATMQTVSSITILKAEEVAL